MVALATNNTSTGTLRFSRPDNSTESVVITDGIFHLMLVDDLVPSSQRLFGPKLAAQVLGDGVTKASFGVGQFARCQAILYHVLVTIHQSRAWVIFLTNLEAPEIAVS